MTERYPDAPGHRSVDTSIAAAEAIAPTLGRLQRMALDAIRDAGPQGHTAEELAAVLKLDRTTVQPRTSELKRKGMIHDSGQRRQNATGKRAIVWTATASTGKE
jgi:DNA-binding MarR family transcriptional regulator